MDLETKSRAEQTQGAWLRAVFNGMGDGVIKTDESLRVEYINPAAQRITGWSQAEGEGQRLEQLLQLMDGTFGDTLDKVLSQALQTDGEAQFPPGCRLTTREGVQWDLVGTLVPVRDSQGGVKGTVVVFGDAEGSGRAVEPKDAEGDLYGKETSATLAQLRTHAERFRSVVEKSFVGIAIVNDRFEYIYANGEFCRMTGYSVEEILGRKFTDLLSDKSKALAAGRYQKRQRGEPVPEHYEFWFVHKTGATRIGEVRSAVYVDAAGRANSIIQIIDVTERRAAEEEKAKLQAQLQQAQRIEAVGRLAGGVAHDFNNMLGAILGHAELALAEEVALSPALRDHLQEITSAAQRSADLTRQLLAFARKETVAPQVLDLNENIGGMIKMLVRLLGEDIRLRWVPGPELWPVEMDASQVDQIVANLCVNAKDAIDDVGEIAIETKNCTLEECDCGADPDCKPGNYVSLTVEDKGCGMDEDTLAHIFEPFFTTKALGEGTGLGLATVFGAVKQNGGSIRVESEPGRGTSVKILLPRYEGDDRTENDSTPEGLLPQGHETVLLVEDESALLKVTQVMLEDLGYTVIATGDPREAILLAQRRIGEIHLLLTDVIMPGMNGRDLSVELHSRDPGLRTLFVSGYPANVIARHGVLERRVAFLRKPFTSKKLAFKIREVLEGQ